MAARIRAPRTVPASLSAQVPPVPLTLNPRPWATSEPTHCSGLSLAQSGAAAEAGIQEAPSHAAMQPGEESVGFFGTDLDVR